MEDSNNFLENIGDIDGEQDIARSAYADMLHDIERNEKYEKAIAKVISQMKNKGISVNVLDIGTGTGLLSMMAAKHGADSIVACEAFTPVAECAVKVIEDNGYSASIKVIPKRSTDLIVGNDLPKKANLVVAELYDTELIGEGAILSYNHARKELLEEDFLSVPSRARIYAQLLECPLARSWNRPFFIEVTKNESIMPPPEAEICSGAPAVHDIQMSQLLSESFTAITDPAEVFCFDWLSPCTPSTGHNVTNLKTIAPGSVNAVFFWWTTDMDPEGEIILSCAPVWAHPDAKKGLLPWRDHWMQAVYYLPNDVCASEIGVELVLEAFHDEYSLWFRLGERHHNNSPIAVKETRPICNCLLHLAYSRPRLGLLNDKTRQNKYINALKRYLFPGATVLSLGDGSWLSLIAAKLGATVIAIETNPMCRRVIESYSESNGLQNNLTILSGSIDKFSERSFDKKINFVIAEHFFEDSVLPWDHLYFWMEIKKIKSFLDPGMKVLPSRVKIKGLGVRFHDLHKIQTPIVETCGFSMKQFDDLIQEAIDSIDETIEPHPLWEYPCTALTDIVNILELSFALDDKSSHSNLTDVEVTATDEINGVVIWCEWFLDDDIVISTGPRSPTNKGEVIHWDLHSKQGCHFLRNINNINSWSRLQFLAMENDCEISIEINRI